MNTVDFVFC